MIQFQKYLAGLALALLSLPMMGQTVSDAATYEVLDGLVAGRPTVMKRSPQDQSYWIGTEHQGLIRLGRNGRTIRYDVASGKLPSNQVQDIQFSLDNTLWILFSDGKVWTFTAMDGFRPVDSLPDPVTALAPGSDSLSICAFSSNASYLISREKGVTARKDSNLIPFESETSIDNQEVSEPAKPVEAPKVIGGFNWNWALVPLLFIAFLVFLLLYLREKRYNDDRDAVLSMTQVPYPSSQAKSPTMASHPEPVHRREEEISKPETPAVSKPSVQPEKSPEKPVSVAAVSVSPAPVEKPVAPAPVKIEPEPKPVEAAPVKIEPLPKPVESAPAPKPAEPAPKPAAPAPKPMPTQKAPETASKQPGSHPKPVAKQSEDEPRLFDLQSEFLERVNSQISAHLADPDFGVEQLAAALHISRIHLNRKLKAEGVDSPSNLLKSARMKLAADMLLQGNHNISDIATRCGFSTPSYFSTAFKDYFNMTPSDFLAQKNLSR